MVVEPTSLIESDDKQSLLPLWSSTDSVVKLLQQNLSIRDQARWMHGSGANTTAAWVDVGKFRKTAEVSILEEVLQRLNVCGAVMASAHGPIIVQGISTVGSGVVVCPGVVSFAELLEDGTLRKNMLAETGIISSVAC